jgi:hypothetical protein
MKKYYALSFLIGISPIMAEKRDVPCNMSECELYNLYNCSYDRAVYFGKDLSNIAAVLKEISVLDDNPNSCLNQLSNCIDKGCMFGEWDAVAQTLDYADFILKKYHTRLPEKTVKKLAIDLELVITQMINGGLAADSATICFGRYNEGCGNDKEVKFCFNTVFKENVTIDKGLNVKGATKLYGKLTVYDKALFKKKAIFKEIVVKDLSAHDAIIDNLTVTNCIKNLCVDNLSVGELIIASCIDSLCVTNLSIVGCLADLCVNNLSVVNESVSGTLSVNDAIINNATIEELSATNAVIQNLSVTELVVLSCMDSLCVNTLSVNDFIASTVDVLCNLSVGCNILMHNTESPLIGNILKDGERFIHNAGTDNTFMGIDAGNFTTTGVGRNSAYGVNALQSNTTGYDNIAIGVDALLSNTTGISNIAVGNFALSSNTNGSENIGIGTSSLASNTTGLFNVAVGTNTLQANTTGSVNAAFGTNALESNTTGFFNVGVGNFALEANTTGYRNAALGNFALAANTTGIENVAVGNFALEFNTIGFDNSAVGNFALT